MGGGNRLKNYQTHEPTHIVPHPRTLRKAREQVKYMVIDEVSPRRIRNYLQRWAAWWAKTSEDWQYQELLQWFIDVCWNAQVSAYAACAYQLHFNKLCTRTDVVAVAAAVSV
jgi:hypothetical protein